MNYDGKKFRAIHNSLNGEVDNDLIFEYSQKNEILYCEYSAKNIILGQLLGTVDDKGIISMSYQQINKQGVLRTGICRSTPFINDKGLLELHEEWEWTSGNKSKGKSILIEVI